MANDLSRRGFLSLSGGLVAAGLTLPTAGLSLPAVAETATGTENEEAALYYRLLLQHTRWVETIWDAAAGHYSLADFNFVSVLGNAVLLRFNENYDAALAGVSEATLLDHTIRTIDYFAATNWYARDVEWGGPDHVWGGRIFWDGTFESYFVAAAKLLWDQLSATTRTNVDLIAVRGAEYVADLEENEDPRGAGWRSNGLQGRFRVDSAIEEMGAKSMPLATGLGYFPDHPRAGDWRHWLTAWMSNMTGLPETDEQDSTLLEGRPVSEWNRAQNIYPAFIVENHSSYAPIYQESVGAYPGRNAIHFLIGGTPLPDVFHYQPNADGLWRTLLNLSVRSGLSSHPMVADRYHLYGRDVLPYTWRRMGQGDRFVGRAERMLMAHLQPYVSFPPVNRLTKFSGEPKYEPEARSEVAMAYLLHRWRDRLHGDVKPANEAAYWANVSGVTDYGEMALVSHQSANTLALAITKPGFVKFAFLPEHDDWLFNVSAGNPAFIPSTASAVQAKATTIYREAEHGFHGSAHVLRLANGFVGFATLPTGAVVYTTTGTATTEGVLRLQALNMPGVLGLDGDRTFTGADGSVTLTSEGVDGGVDELSFPPVRARHVRMLGGRPATVFGYSLWEFEVYAPGGTVDFARGRPTTASSNDPAFLPQFATDGDPNTRWAVARAERPRGDSWLMVDLGEAREIDHVRLRWDPAFGAEYSIQVSDDGVNWQTVRSVPPDRQFPPGWLNVENRAGFVVRGSENPIRVTATSMVLSSGPASGSAGMVVEGYPGQSADRTAQLAAAPAPVTSTAALTASVVNDYLSVFNLSAAAVTGTVQVESTDAEVAVFPGTRSISGTTATVDVSLPALGAEIRPAGFLISSREDDGEPLELDVEVIDASTLRVTNTREVSLARITVTGVAAGRPRPLDLRPGSPRTITFPAS